MINIFEFIVWAYKKTTIWLNTIKKEVGSSMYFNFYIIFGFKK